MLFDCPLCSNEVDAFRLCFLFQMLLLHSNNNKQFMAPEVSSGKEYDEKCDGENLLTSTSIACLSVIDAAVLVLSTVWSFGVVLYEVSEMFQHFTLCPLY